MPRIHTLDMQRLTPLGQLIAEYMRQQWPRLQTKAEFAHHVGVRPGTIDNLLYSQRAASSRTLNKIAHATGIPAAVLYEAAAGQQPQAYVRPSAPPMLRDPEERRQPPRIAEEQSPYAALDDYVRRVQLFGLPDNVKRAMIESMYAALKLPPLPASSPPWDDHDAVSTMQMAAIPPAAAAEVHDTNPSQVKSQPAESHT